MNKFFVKGISSVSLTASVCSAANSLCSMANDLGSAREFPTWFYGEGEIPEEGKKWFKEQFFVNAYHFMSATAELGEEYNEVNKNEVENAFVNLAKFGDALYVRGLTLDYFGNLDRELKFLEEFGAENLWWLEGEGLFPLTKWYYMNNRTDDQKKAADFIVELVEKWRPFYHLIVYKSC